MLSALRLLLPSLEEREYRKPSENTENERTIIIYCNYGVGPQNVQRDTSSHHLPTLSKSARQRSTATREKRPRGNEAEAKNEGEEGMISEVSSSHAHQNIIPIPCGFHQFIMDMCARAC